MKIILHILLIVCCLYCADKASGASLINITHESDNGHTAVKLEFDGPVKFAEHFITSPERLYIDIEQSTIASATKTYPVNSNTVNAVRAGRFDKQTLRIVFDLGSMFGGYNISTLSDPNSVVVDLYTTKNAFGRDNKTVTTLPPPAKDNRSPAEAKAPAEDKKKADDNNKSIEQQLSGILYSEKYNAVFFNKGDEKKITLRDTFLETLQRNLAIKSAKLAPVSAGLDISSAKAVFYPTLTQAFSLSGNPVSRTSGMSLSPAGLSLPLLTGGSLSVLYATSANLSQDAATQYQSTLGTVLTMPLLAGAGYFVNWAPVVIAEINELNSRIALREQIETMFVSVNAAYWNLKVAKEQLLIQLEALNDAVRLHNKTLELIKEGEIAVLDKYQTEAAISSREDALINAVKAFRDAQDTLLNLLNRDLSENISPEDPPTFDYIDPDYQNSLNAAFENRTDYLQALESLKISEINLKLAKNSSLPNLSLNFGYGTGSSMDTGGLGRSIIHGADERSWTASLNYTIPIPNTIRNNAYLKSKIALDQANINMDKLKESVKKEIRQGIIAVLSSKKKVEVAKKTQELNQLKLDAEKAKLEEGLSELFTVISYQNDLVSAQLAYVSATVDYQNAVIALKKSEGVLSSFLNIKIHDAAVADTASDSSEN
ncbi:MAG: TolC family protein [Nitrospirae bacterium]|nr:TolC family protein [Nitrospirota bacterium]